VRVTTISRIEVGKKKRRADRGACDPPGGRRKRWRSRAGAAGGCNAGVV